MSSADRRARERHARVDVEPAQPRGERRALALTALDQLGRERLGQARGLLTDPLLDNFTAAKKTVCKLTPDQTKLWVEKAKPVWDLYSKKSPGNKALLDAILAAKKDFAAGKK